MKNRELSLEKLYYFISLTVVLLFFPINLYCHYNVKEAASDLLSANLVKSIKITGQLASQNKFNVIMGKLRLSQDNIARLVNDAQDKIYSALIWELFTPVLSVISVISKRKYGNCTFPHTVIFWCVFIVIDGITIYNIIGAIDVLKLYNDLKDNIEIMRSELSLKNFIMPFP